MNWVETLGGRNPGTGGIGTARDRGSRIGDRRLEIGEGKIQRGRKKKGKKRRIEKKCGKWRLLAPKSGKRESGKSGKTAAGMPDGKSEASGAVN